MDFELDLFRLTPFGGGMFSPKIGGWRIRHDAFCRDVCAPLHRAPRWADVLVPSVCAAQGRIHPGEERRDVCATRVFVVRLSNHVETMVDIRDAAGRILRAWPCG